MSASTVRYSPRFEPCPKCGAWTWEQDGDFLARDQFLCGACNHVVRCQDILSVLTGGD